MTRLGVLVLALLALLPGRALRAAEPHWPEVIVIATASPGGAYHAYGLGLARLLGRALRVAVSVRETEGPSENIRLVTSGQAQIGFVTTGAALQAWSGTGGWTEGRRYQSITAIFPMFDTPFHFVVRRDSTIGALRDLAGASLGVGPAGGTGADYAPRILAALGIVAPLANEVWDTQAAQLAAGQLQGLVVASGVPFPALSALERQRAVRYLPLTREQVVALRLGIPELDASAIPAGTYPSMRQRYDTVGLFNLAIAHRDLPVDLVQAILRAVFENNAELAEAHAAAAATVPANFTRNTVLPWHPGALRYFERRALQGVGRSD